MTADSEADEAAPIPAPRRGPAALQALTHLDEHGRATMVDVGDKPESRRRAVATATLQLSPAGARSLRAGSLPKGSPSEVVRLAGIQGAKQTALLVPLCHPLRLTGIAVELEEQEGDRWRVVASVSAIDRTGVEMEAMTAAAVGALALYDMVKAVDRGARIVEVALQSKEGGKSGRFERPESRR